RKIERFESRARFFAQMREPRRVAPLARLGEEFVCRKDVVFFFNDLSHEPNFNVNCSTPLPRQRLLSLAVGFDPRLNSRPADAAWRLEQSHSILSKQSR